MIIVSTPELSFETWTEFEYFYLKYLMLPNSFMQKDLRNPKNLADYQEVYKYKKNFT